ncbi:MAG: excinuclease ABC subunit UvrA [Oscillospiraceae bacterium]|nr:excinuclease ABC subunit UvrA [Oscillospiraceae bacterium]
MNDYIKIIGAKENNLKNVSVDIKHNCITAVTGVSGSGKSSLIFDVLYSEGQKKFMELNGYETAYMSNSLPKADVEEVKGLTPVVAIDQKETNRNPRSTVGTRTGLNKLVNALFAKAGTMKCPKCDTELKQMSIISLVTMIMELPDGYTAELRSPIEKRHNQNYENFFDEIKKKLFTKIYVDSVEHDLANDSDINIENYASFEIFLDKFSVDQNMFRQIMKSVEVMTDAANNPLIHLLIRNGNGENDRNTDELYRKLGCCGHEYILMELESTNFSFNDSRAACPTCLGLGFSFKANPDFFVVNPKKGLYRGALHPSIFQLVPESKNGVVLYTLSQKYGFDLYKPYEELSDEVKDILMYGTRGEKIKIINTPDAKRRSPFTGFEYAFKGFVEEMEQAHTQGTFRNGTGEKEGWADKENCMVQCECPECNGKRLKPQFYRITVNGKTIDELVQMQLKDFLLYCNEILINGSCNFEVKVILEELSRKLKVLCNIGLYYLNIDRQSNSLSGGETQRIKLSKQLGSDMSGIVYIMDEPSIGLHMKDVRNMIRIIKEIKDNGNTVIVVEHNLDVICAGDNVIEIGPGAGTEGGEIIYNGTGAGLLEDEKSLTKEYILDKNKVKPNLEKEFTVDENNCLKIYNATQNNLKNITVSIPLNSFVCITGVSGSGKSTLINDILVKKLQYEKYHKPVMPGKHTKIEGIEKIRNIINIDQSQIGTSNTSTPATYMELFDRIRTLYAKLPDCVNKGYTAQDFSLTYQNGLRCHKCAGKGIIVTKLQYMPDIESVCPVCKGECYSNEALKYKYQGRNIHEILNLSVNQALDFFKDDDYLYKKFTVMNDLGLGYIKLGQHTSTISGGEAQRLKLSYELSKNKGKDNNLYIFDEPSTGLHADDVRKLIDSIYMLVKNDNSVIVIEHDMDFIKSSQYIIDIGPEGGLDGGEIVAQGTPYQISQCEKSYTGQFLKEYFLL